MGAVHTLLHGRDQARLIALRADLCPAVALVPFCACRGGLVGGTYGLPEPLPVYPGTVAHAGRREQDANFDIVLSGWRTCLW